MSLDEKGRKERASKAGKKSGEARHPPEMTERDKNILLAYLYLTGAYQPNKDRQKALKFLDDSGVSPKLNKKYGETAHGKLAEATGLSSERIRQILKKPKK